MPLRGEDMSTRVKVILILAFMAVLGINAAGIALIYRYSVRNAMDQQKASKEHGARVDSKINEIDETVESMKLFNLGLAEEIAGSENAPVQDQPSGESQPQAEDPHPLKLEEIIQKRMAAFEQEPVNPSWAQEKEQSFSENYHDWKPIDSRITATVPSFKVASIECKSMQCMLKVSLKKEASERDMVREVDDLISRSSKECGFTWFPYNEKDNIQTWFVDCFTGGKL
jgi:hypothetical protein